MTGVGVLIPRGFDIAVGTIVSVEICGASGEAIIRTTRVVDAAWAHYGLEYCPLGDAFHEVVSDLVAGTHRNFDWQWNIAQQLAGRAASRRNLTTSGLSLKQRGRAPV